MALVVFAAICSVLALVSGFAAVGNGRHFQYNFKDIVNGKRNAILYCWVTLSTMFSLAQSASTVGYALNPKFGVGSTIAVWSITHALMGILLTTAHAYIYLSLEARGADCDEHFWGKNRVRQL
jgi:hypothetical protein